MIYSILFWTIKNLLLKWFSVKDIDTQGILKSRQNNGEINKIVERWLYSNLSKDIYCSGAPN